ncbi:GyrI-like domain-containing protein [Paenibacillus nasutitermitis]|uniref:AraC family transcriptional regulator n=1 Tax=Paenibacillus nasutitermitis TaxID=1652958 RepID=A0A916ZDG3_9BACL|nr:GyrI-like domain-containing protein [Paenibacillus nasutitermitis]GGD89570.1 AraC family transcriptional regulator [Paenibacillus nasutitermitis]
MEYRMEEKKAFRIVGKSIQVSMENGENNRRIPEFWKQSDEDGTVSALEAVSPGKDLLGICSMLPGDELLTYIIAVESDSAPSEGYISMTIPSASWAVFPSVGPLPGAIQQVWQHIFGEWFSSTGYEHAQAPDIEVYGPGDTTAADYRCEVWIPVIAKQS